VSEKTTNVELDLNESGTLCNLLMRAILQSGGTASQPPWVIDLYTKLATANDKLMYLDRTK
jgi:hypothetical protein